MDIASQAAVGSALSPAELRDTVGISVLKKALDIQASSVLTLLQALPQTPSNPSNLGNSVDVRA